MLKELFLAIILGALLGFGLTGGYFSLKKNPFPESLPVLPSAPPPQPALSTSPQPVTPTESTPQTSTHTISVESPQNESIVANSKITLKGSTSPQSYLIIVTSKNTYTAKSDSTGNFSLDVDVDSGANIISFTAIDASDNSASIEILVTYSTAKI